MGDFFKQLSMSHCFSFYFFFYSVFNCFLSGRILLLFPFSCTTCMTVISPPRPSILFKSCCIVIKFKNSSHHRNNTQVSYDLWTSNGFYYDQFLTESRKCWPFQSTFPLFLGSPCCYRYCEVFFILMFVYLFISLSLICPQSWPFSSPH